VKEIPLTKGMVALVDDQDYERVMQYKWHADYCHNTRSFIAERSFRAADGKWTRQPMSRFILDAPPEILVDHRNHNTLDNQRFNIRKCTHAQNQRNARKRCDNTSGYKGVSSRSHTKKFRARIKVNGREIFLGYFYTKREAALAYNQAALRLHGEFAHLNDIQEAAV
jgi:hypothetical protein